MNIAQIKVQMYDYNEELVEVRLFQLLQWHSAMQLEAKGMKMSRGRSVTAHVRKVLSTPPRFKREALIGHLRVAIDDANEQLGIPPLKETP